MPLKFNGISDYKSEKFIVKNISGGNLVIGDLNIKIQRDQSIDLLYQDKFSKKPLRS